VRLVRADSDLQWAGSTSRVLLNRAWEVRSALRRQRDLAAGTAVVGPVREVVREVVVGPVAGPSATFLKAGR
jgi:hypothetical protein